RRRLGDQRIEIERRIRGQVQNRAAAAGDDLAVQRVAALDEARAGIHQRESDDAALDDAGGDANPPAVDGQLLEVADADDDGGDADVEQPAGADDRLERIFFPV